MSYKHILVAVDLTPESNILLSKATKLAKSIGAELSLIHVDPNVEKTCKEAGLVDIDLHDNCQIALEGALAELKKLTETYDYPIKHCLVGAGEYENVLKGVIEKYQIDLVICGHHHTFLSRVFSSNQPILNTLDIEVLIIPLTNET